jgi:putative restriction endonuclease
MDRNTLADYMHALSHLHTASGNAFPVETLQRAPHKPILLLAVLDLAAQGKLTENFVAISPDLAELFRGYWVRVMPSSRKTAQWAYPFFYLRSEGFWHLVPKTGMELDLKQVRNISSLSHLQDVASGARLDDALYALICIEDTRNTLRATLIERYFSESVRDALIAQGNLNLATYQYAARLLDRKHLRETTDTGSEYLAVRSAGFRQAIVTAYDHRCVLCGMRIVTENGRTAAMAAHIIPWSHSHNDDPRNGLCLCRMCHWVFDEGLATVTAQYHVCLSTQLRGQTNIAGHLLTLNGRPIFEPIDSAWNPDTEALEWHTREIFQV